MSFHLQKGSCHQGKKMFEINQAKPIPTALKDMSCNNNILIAWLYSRDSEPVVFWMGSEHQYISQTSWVFPKCSQS